MRIEELPNGPGHRQTQVGVDVDLADRQLGSMAQLILGHADGAGHLAAVGIDHLYIILRHRGGAVEHNGESGQPLGNLLQHVETQLGLGPGLKLVSAVGGADGNGQGVAAGLGDELLHFLGAGIGGILRRDLHIVLDTGQGAQLGLHHHAVVVGILHHLLGDLDVFGEGLGRGVDHDGGKAAVNAGFAGLKVGAVVQVQDDGNFGALQHRRLDQLDQVCVVGISPGTLGDLQDDRGLLLPAGFRDALHDFHIVDIESAYGIAAVISFLKHFLRSYQRHCKHSFSIPADIRLFSKDIISQMRPISIILFAIRGILCYHFYVYAQTQGHLVQSV